ncbi:MAG: HigA family addiction module antitoxin [Pseudomonadota bacterium]
MSSSSTITEAKKRGTGLGRRMHPGEVVAELFLDAEGLVAEDLAAAVHLPLDEIQSFLNAKRDVDAELATRLHKALGPDPRYWLNMQTNFDLSVFQSATHDELDTITPLYDAAE